MCQRHRPGAINDRREVGQTYVDSSGEHGFLAIPRAVRQVRLVSVSARCFPAHARQGGVNGLRPGVPGIPGGSPHCANGSGRMDQTAAAGALRFVRRPGKRPKVDAGIVARQRRVVGRWRCAQVIDLSLRARPRSDFNINGIVDSRLRQTLWVALTRNEGS